uniref:Uncharacterized protein n=1 Tax=Arundo donax TaxID=35708 RepID=A0A0A9ENR4_ARUDO
MEGLTWGACEELVSCQRLS